MDEKEPDTERVREAERTTIVTTGGDRGGGGAIMLAVLAIAVILLLLYFTGAFGRDSERDLNLDIDAPDVEVTLPPVEVPDVNVNLTTPPPPEANEGNASDTNSS